MLTFVNGCHSIGGTKPLLSALEGSLEKLATLTIPAELVARPGADLGESEVALRQRARLDKVEGRVRRASVEEGSRVKEPASQVVGRREEERVEE